MSGKSYQLTFIGSVLVIFVTIVLFIYVFNLLMLAVKFSYRKVYGGPLPRRSSSTQTFWEMDQPPEKKESELVIAASTSSVGCDKTE